MVKQLINIQKGKDKLIVNKIKKLYYTINRKLIYKFMYIYNPLFRYIFITGRWIFLKGTNHMCIIYKKKTNILL